MVKGRPPGLSLAALVLLLGLSEQVQAQAQTSDHAAAAANTPGETIFQSAGAETQIKSPVSIVPPLGHVSISGAGDQLGAKRYGRRQGSETFVVRFSPTKEKGSASSPRPYAIPTGLPVDGAVLTSDFGFRRHPISGDYRRHRGIDLAAPRGTPIRATLDGVVTKSGWAGGYGIMVQLDHGSGLETRYAHMSRALVNPGQRITRGQLIGLVGSTGRSTGPHVHYEVRTDKVAVNPVR